jgi:hypothetical protein
MSRIIPHLSGGESQRSPPISRTLPRLPRATRQKASWTIGTHNLDAPNISSGVPDPHQSGIPQHGVLRSRKR